jgi:tRNA A-37 threonylcarbamoyl transferase component Bud32
VKAPELGALAARLARGETPAGVEIVKRSPVRVAACTPDAFLKVFLGRSQPAAREARNLARAAERGLPVPAPIAHGADWIAMQRLAHPRPATRADLADLLALSRSAHDAGMVHGDLHVGNFAWSSGRLWLLDLQRARWLPRVPRWLRGRDLGFLAYSLGEPLPPELEAARRWRDRRAHTHWRSRTRRCLTESSGFTAFEHRGVRGFRARDADPDALRRALDASAAATRRGSGAELWRAGTWIVKRHPSARAARSAWRNGHGLEVRGIATGRARAWVGELLVMEDAGPDLDAWLASGFESAPDAVRCELADALGGLLAALHRRGVYHADLKATNVAWRPGVTPRLLDYGSVRFARRVSRQHRIKNLAQLNAAVPDLVGAELRERALDAYLAGAESRDARAELRTAVIAASLARAHRWTGC